MARMLDWYTIYSVKDKTKRVLSLPELPHAPFETIRQPFVVEGAIAQLEELSRLRQRLREIGVDSPELFPVEIQRSILQIAECLNTEKGKELLRKFRVVRYGWGMVDDNEVLLVVYVDTEEFGKKLRNLEERLLPKWR